MVTRQLRGAVTIAALAVLHACAGLDPYRPPATGSPAGEGPVVPAQKQGEVTAPSSVPAVTQPAPVAPKPSGPAAHLLSEAQRLSARREFDRASAQVERALRIEPSNPWLYLALADIRLAQRDTGQAAVLVQKARSLSRGDPQLLREAEALRLRNPAPAGPP